MVFRSVSADAVQDTLQGQKPATQGTAAGTAKAQPWDAETEVFKAAKEAFGGAGNKGLRVSVRRYELGDPKIALRTDITEEQIGVRVSFPATDGKGVRHDLSVAGMVPVTASADAVRQLIGRLKQDKLRAEDVVAPKGAQ